MKPVTLARAARADLRRIDAQVARRILEALGRLARTGTGDVKKLAGGAGEFRLRVGDWRVRYTESEEGIEVERVLHRSEAYR